MLRTGILQALVFTLGVQAIRAGNATWNLNPSSNDWNTATNWTPATVPNGNTDKATFDLSDTTTVAITATTDVASIVFNGGAPAYTFNASQLTVHSPGITNNSGVTQSFSGTIFIAGTASTGTPVQFTGPFTIFYSQSSAGNSSFIGGLIDFTDGSTAANATFKNANVITFSEFASAGDALIINNGATVSGAHGGRTKFIDESDAGNATIVSIGGTVSGAEGGSTIFEGVGNSAINATLIANGGTNGGLGGTVSFEGSYFDGGNSRAIAGAGGGFHVSDSLFRGMSIGSIEGAGDYFLDGVQLRVGANNLSTAVSGVIRDSGASFAGGTLTKTGTGTLSLTNGNTYSGGTIIETGTLEALHAGALGTGDVSLTTPSAKLTLRDGTLANGAISATAVLSIVSGSTVNLDFPGSRQIASLVVDGIAQPVGEYGSAASGAANQLSEFTGAGKLQVTGPTAVSRKSHGGNAFDLYLPFAVKGVPGIEPRSGGLSNVYQVVVSYLNPVTFTSASVTSGTGMVVDATGSGTPNITVNLAGVTNEQIITVTLFGVNDGATIKDIPIRMGILIGDVTGNGQVNFSDVSQTKARSGQMISPSNYRVDVNGNGSINASDVSQVKLKSGTSLPVTRTSYARFDRQR